MMAGASACTSALQPASLTRGDLTTLADVRAWLQTGPQPYPATDDMLLARLITAASRFVQTWLNRPLLSGDWQETRDGPGSYGWETTFAFAVQPATAVILVVVNNLTIPAVPFVPPAPPGQIAQVIRRASHGARPAMCSRHRR